MQYVKSFEALSITSVNHTFGRLTLDDKFITQSVLDTNYIAIIGDLDVGRAKIILTLFGNNITAKTVVEFLTPDVPAAYKFLDADEITSYIKGRMNYAAEIDVKMTFEGAVNAVTSAQAREAMKIYYTIGIVSYAKQGQCSDKRFSNICKTVGVEGISATMVTEAWKVVGKHFSPEIASFMSNRIRTACIDYPMLHVFSGYMDYVGMTGYKIVIEFLQSHGEIPWTGLSTFFANDFENIKAARKVELASDFGKYLGFPKCPKEFETNKFPDLLYFIRKYKVDVLSDTSLVDFRHNKSGVKNAKAIDVLISNFEENVKSLYAATFKKVMNTEADPTYLSSILNPTVDP